VNSALRLLTRSPRAIQIAPCQTIWSTISNNLTTAWLAACADSPWAGVRPVVYLFDRAAWWAAWLASAQRRAPVPANGGYGFSTSAVAPPDWVRLWATSWNEWTGQPSGPPSAQRRGPVRQRWL
jgi:hypothetical protein